MHLVNKQWFIALIDNRLSIYSVYLVLKTLYMGISRLDVLALTVAQKD